MPLLGKILTLSSLAIVQWVSFLLSIKFLSGSPEVMIA